jgi:hypothetical protein
MSCCYWHHCPYHHHHWPGWAEAYPRAPYGPPPPSVARDEYVTRLESERAALEQRLRRIEDQLAELQRERTK